jgi:alkanesulfonate monooxygenase SsuD/methylene tetrahydromethanopterin reductase-like flavin-dependent oxidoreductase (luciferase family)
VKLGVSLPVFTDDVARPLNVARRAAEAGYEGAFAPDHLFPPGRPGSPSIDAFTLLSAVGASYPELTIGTLVTRASLRPAGLLAKQAAGLAEIAGRGAVLGLGMGDKHSLAEHQAYGIPFPPIEERRVMLEETALACRALFRGEPWPGGDRVPAIAGPILPRAPAEVWLGGVSERVIESAARAGEAWNGWQLDADGFEGRALRLAELAREAGRDPVEVPPTWGGIALVGEDAAALRTLEEERATKGLPMNVWHGTVDDLRIFADRLRAAGGTWLVVVPAGPSDRLDLIARSLRGG